MSTFNNTSLHTFIAVSEFVDQVDIDKDKHDVHTVSLELDGQHGEFNLVIQATGEHGEDFEWRGVAHRSGGVSGFHQVKDATGDCAVCQNRGR